MVFRLEVFIPAKPHEAHAFHQEVRLLSHARGDILARDVGAVMSTIVYVTKCGDCTSVVAHQTIHYYNMIPNKL